PQGGKRLAGGQRGQEQTARGRRRSERLPSKRHGRKELAAGRCAGERDRPDARERQSQQHAAPFAQGTGSYQRTPPADEDGRAVAGTEKNRGAGAVGPDAASEEDTPMRVPHPAPV